MPIHGHFGQIVRYGLQICFAHHLHKGGGGGGGGVQDQKSWKHDFEIAGDPKGSLSGSTFWFGFAPFLEPKNSKIANKAQTGIC